MQGPQERIEQAKLGARSAARDLLRLVRALDAHDIDLDALEEAHREALEVCNHELATALSASPVDDASVRRMEAAVEETKARLRATRSAILDALGKTRRVKVLESMLAVEVVDEDLEVEAVAPSSEDLEQAKLRAQQRYLHRRRNEARRRRAERLGVDPEAGAQRSFARLPKPWLTAVFRNAGLVGHPSPSAAARCLLDLRALAAVVAGLRAAERDALAALLAADGVVLARVLEGRWGDSSEDGWDWHREPPTSVLGRLRARGLCVVGRASIGPNPRSRPRVVVVPMDLRRPLVNALSGTTRPRVADPMLPEQIIDEVMDRDAGDAESDEEAEAQGIRFDREQPELASFASGLAECMSEAVGPGGLLFYVARIWEMFEAAHPGRVPRLRKPDLEVARVASNRDLEAVEQMHERLLERRVATLISAQPHLYSYLAGVLDELPWEEADKLLVFHACDTTLRAFHAALTL